MSDSDFTSGGLPKEETIDAFLKFLNTIGTLSENPVFRIDQPNIKGLIGVCLLVTPSGHVEVMSNVPPPQQRAIVEWHLSHCPNRDIQVTKTSDPN